MRWQFRFFFNRLLRANHPGLAARCMGLDFVRILRVWHFAGLRCDEALWCGRRDCVGHDSQVANRWC